MNKQLLTLSLTAALSFHAGFAMDEERLAEKNKEAVVPGNLQRFQPESLKDICIQDLLSTTFNCKSMQELTKKLKDTTLPIELQEAFLQNNIEKFYPELLDAYKKRFGGIKIKSKEGYLVCSFSPDGQYLAICMLEGIYLCKYKNKAQIMRDFINHATGVIGFTANNQLFVINSDAIDVYTYNDHVCKRTKTIAPRGHIEKTYLSPDGQHLAVDVRGHMTRTYTTKVWSNQSNELQPLVNTPDGIAAIRFSPNSQHLAIQLFDKTTQIWTHKDNSFEQMAVLDNPAGFTESISFDADNNLLVQSMDGTVLQTWKYENNQWESTSTANSQPSAQKATNDPGYVSPDGLYEVIMQEDNTAQVVPTLQYFQGLNLQELEELLKPQDEELAESNLAQRLQKLHVTDNSSRG
ncbi:MAG: WD40 repeat domain-containing protein [Epsilonproteobacteria bacterium]|nr:WD40 repeat domain-containing protein [Campylobacterota bacterium]